MYLNRFKDGAITLSFSLTLTWDVFKCEKTPQSVVKEISLTLTWDVFKYP